jgi:hypothetical protein
MGSGEIRGSCSGEPFGRVGCRIGCSDLLIRMGRGGLMKMAQL